LIRRLRDRDERGAVAVVVGAFSLVMVLIAAFVVDIGVQRVARRDMQSLADIVALDLARELDGRTVDVLSPLMPDLAAASVRRNQSVIGDEPELHVELGRLDADGTFVRLTAPKDVPSAVRVEAATSVGFAFVPGRGGAVRSAVADTAGGACFQIGSYAAALDTGASPLLGPLLGALGSNINLTAGNYQALADAQVELLDLLGANVGAVTLQEALEGSRLVSLADYYLATASALAKESGQTATVALLQSLAASVAPLDLTIPIAELLSLDTGRASGLDAALNVLDLVTAGAQLATGEYGVLIPQARVNLGPVADVETKVHVIEAPRLGCGRKNDPLATASNSAVSLELSAAALTLKLGVLNTRVSLDGSIQVASAKGQLTDVRCDPEGITVKVSDGLLRVDLTLEIKIDAVFGLIPGVSGPIRIRGESDSNGDAVINISTDSDYDRPIRVDNSSSGLPRLSTDTSQLKVLGGLLPIGAVLGIILDPLLDGLINPLIQGLDRVLLSPLLKTLGMDLSGADVFAKRTPKCDQPALRG